MPYDPLAQYRSRLTPDTPRSAAESNEYTAFGTKDKIRRLKIRCAKSITHSPGYNILLNLTYDGAYGTQFVLVFSVMMVIVQGKNLQNLIYALENDNAEFIQEFDPARWAKPTDANAPLIESIEVKLTDGPGGVAGDGRH